MGGIRVDEGHRTNRSFLYAAGECACAYHGANRLGGNSLLGAIFGGRCAAESVMKDLAGASKGNGNARRIEASNSNENAGKTRFAQASDDENGMEFLNGAEEIMSLQIAAYSSLSCDEQSIEKKMEEALFSGLSILRNEERLTQAHQTILQLYNRKETLSDELRARLHLAEAMLLSALERKESRGAHTRMDYPETKDAFRAQTCAKWEAGRVGITFEKRAL
ncbi:MAG: FAD-binding protein [Lachnospiraceae bacterium]|nr:FAD-binding protein [Lachnospiraceae bacterium]